MKKHLIQLSKKYLRDWHQCLCSNERLQAQESQQAFTLKKKNDSNWILKLSHLLIIWLKNKFDYNIYQHWYQQEKKRNILWKIKFHWNERFTDRSAIFWIFDSNFSWNFSNIWLSNSESFTDNKISVSNLVSFSLQSSENCTQKYKLIKFSNFESHFSDKEDCSADKSSSDNLRFWLSNSSRSHFTDSQITQLIMKRWSCFNHSTSSKAYLNEVSSSIFWKSL